MSTPSEPEHHAAMFDERSAIRHINKESILLLGGGRALLMQIAHPQVAAGVAEHSAFRDDRIGRLVRTLRPVYAMVFGTPEQAEVAAMRLAHRHATVVGAGYSASDPALQLWVYATLVDTALTVYSRFVRPLSPELERAYYQDARRMSRLLGIPATIMPPDLDAFRAYVAETVAALAVSDVARTLAADIFAPRPALAAPLFVTLRALTTGLLPPTLRRQFGFGWGPQRDAMLSASALLSRTLWPHLPRRLRRPAPFLMPPLAPRS